jgi:hypothetical protein
VTGQEPSAEAFRQAAADLEATGGTDAFGAGANLAALIPGWEGSIGPFPGQYDRPHVYARDIHSGAGNCCCGAALGAWLHVQAAPGVPVPPGYRRAGRPA